MGKLIDLSGIVNSLTNTDKKPILIASQFIFSQNAVTEMRCLLYVK